MTAYVALLRGVNVGGHNQIAMPELRQLLESLGHTDVATHLQSGNAVFRSGRRGPTRLATEIEAAIAGRCSLDVTVFVRSRAELAGVVRANPLPEAAAEPSKLLVAFLSATPARGRAEALEQEWSGPEQVRGGDGVLYVWYRDGVGPSKLTNALLDRRLGVETTARNWNTVTKLLEMAAARE
jgi:uncharacterized protein (DUF1697 family)